MSMRNHEFYFISLLLASSFFLQMSCSERQNSKAEVVIADFCKKSAAKDFEIIGGESFQNLSGLAQNTVFVFQKDGSSCTGTLVDRNIVLTAAHCVEASLKDYGNLLIVFSASPELDASEGRIKAVSRRANEIAVHPDWISPDHGKPGRSDGDLALVRIESPAPLAWRTASLSKDYIEPKVCSEILVMGYGKTTDYDAEDNSPIELRGVVINPLSDDTRTKTLAKFRQKFEKTEPKYSPEEIEASLNRLFVMGPEEETIYVEQSRNHGICAGDSGGPAFMKKASDGKVFLVGVASAVLNALDSERKCRSIGSHTSVYFHRDWLEATFMNLRNSDSLKLELFE